MDPPLHEAAIAFDIDIQFYVKRQITILCSSAPVVSPIPINNAETSLQLIMFVTRTRHYE